jgi:hypothetical protein
VERRERKRGELKEGRREKGGGRREKRVWSR